MNKYEKQLAYLKDNGFTYDPIQRAHAKVIHESGKPLVKLGVIIVRDFGNTLINPIFRASGQVYLSLPTLDYLGDLLDKYDRALTRIELGY